MKPFSLIKYTIKETYAVLGVFSVLLGVVCIIDINTIVTNIWGRIFLVICIFFVSLIVGAIKVLLTQKISITLTTDHKLDILFGDLFKQANIVVIPVNRYFDTCIDDNLIAHNSVHGQFVKNIFGGNVQELDEKIEDSLKYQGITSLELNTDKMGKQKAYPLGCIAEIPKSDKTYYLLALTEFDRNNEASCTLEQYYKSIINLLEYIKTHSQGKTVSMPLIGGGFARLNKGKVNILSNLVSICKMYNGHITSDMQIVLYKEDKSIINLHDYK